jgi:DNA-binding Lrp family transcriptional regulator
MDSLDKKILSELMRNSRTPVTQLAKKVRSSREVVNYRISKMQKNGIILKFVTEIDTNLLGYQSASAFINIKAKKENELKEFVKTCEFTSWSGSFAGNWRFGVDIYGKDTAEIDDNFNKVYKNFKLDILSHRLAIYKKTIFMHEKYITPDAIFKFHENNPNRPSDAKDRRILSALSNDARIDIVKISSMLKMSAPAIAKRIRQLEIDGFIKKYSIFIDVSKLGLYQYSVFITNANVDEKGRLVKYLIAHGRVPFVVEYIGDPFLEFGIVVKDPYMLRPILQEIEESFPDNRIQDVFLIQNEFLSIGPPKCVFK